MIVKEPIVCGACGATVTYEAKFCEYCSAKFAPASKDLPVVTTQVAVRAQLPQHATDTKRRVCDMVDGESGYVVPWALGKGGVGIHREYTVYPERGGTAKLKIEKHGGVIYIGRMNFSAKETANWGPECLLQTEFKLWQ